jgi:hypothetical protein
MDHPPRFPRFFSDRPPVVKSPLVAIYTGLIIYPEIVIYRHRPDYLVFSGVFHNPHYLRKLGSVHRREVGIWVQNNPIQAHPVKIIRLRKSWDLFVLWEKRQVRDLLVPVFGQPRLFGWLPFLVVAIGQIPFRARSPNCSRYRFREQRILH